MSDMTVWWVLEGMYESNVIVWIFPDCKAKAKKVVYPSLAIKMTSEDDMKSFTNIVITNKRFEQTTRRKHTCKLFCQLWKKGGIEY